MNRQDQHYCPASSHGSGSYRVTLSGMSRDQIRMKKEEYSQKLWGAASSQSSDATATIKRLLTQTEVDFDVNKKYGVHRLSPFQVLVQAVSGRAQEGIGDHKAFTQSFQALEIMVADPRIDIDLYGPVYKGHFLLLASLDTHHKPRIASWKVVELIINSGRASQAALIDMLKRAVADFKNDFIETLLSKIDEFDINVGFKAAAHAGNAEATQIFLRVDGVDVEVIDRAMRLAAQGEKKKPYTFQHTFTDGSRKVMSTLLDDPRADLSFRPDNGQGHTLLEDFLLSGPRDDWVYTDWTRHATALMNFIIEDQESRLLAGRQDATITARILQKAS